ncbi:MAG: saccharopine dehydrogenase NADP-binding domain-containing protein [Magnetospirillum sp.]|nr:saccharopine dehydrogenase NADP-binding domain-containing protein [Magnetospirillum sp.]
MGIKHAAFAGRLVIVGFGGLGQGVLPLILRHIDMPAERITVVTAADDGQGMAEQQGVCFVRRELTRADYRDVLAPLLAEGDVLLNLSVNVSSLALIALAWQQGALYLDTCIEPWGGGYTDTNLAPAMRSNYALRESALALKEQAGRPTALLTHGANPGIVSHFVKRALLDIARETGGGVDTPASRQDWAQLAERLGIKVIQVAERDSQVSAHRPKAVGEFVNTWSAEGFAAECRQPAEIGWGSHERAMPPDARRHDFGRGSAIYLMRPSAATRVRTWIPSEGPVHGFLITHSETISISDYYTVRDGNRVRYRPSVFYAYHPCDAAVLSVHELAGRNWRLQDERRLMMAEITSGADELGVLLMGHAKGAYWYGSRLSIDEARALAPHNNATSLQVGASVLAGLVWALENPRRGIVEPDEMDFARALEIARPYLGKVGGVYSDWTPLLDRDWLFPEDIDGADPWQFKNFRVA